MLCAELEKGHAEGMAWVREEPSRSEGRGVVVIRGRFQPYTFGHEMMLQFAHGFMEGANEAARGGWSMHYKVSNISANMLKDQAFKKGEITSVTPGAQRREAAAGVVRCAARGGRRRQVGGEVDPNCEAACRIYGIRDCDGVRHIVLIVGTDAAPGKTPNMANEETPCHFIYPYGEDRPEKASGDILADARDAIYRTSRPVPISASLVRAAIREGDMGHDILSVAAPVDPERLRLFRRYGAGYLAHNQHVFAGAAKTCPFCEKAFAAQSAYKTHIAGVHSDRLAGGKKKTTRRRRLRGRGRTRRQRRRSASKRRSPKSRRHRHHRRL